MVNNNNNIEQFSSNEENNKQYSMIPVPLGKKSFEVRMIKGKGGEIRHAIFIDGEILDWSIDMHDFLSAMKMGPKYLNSIKEDIVKHFTASVSDFLGRKVTINELNHARKVGWI